MKIHPSNASNPSSSSNVSALNRGGAGNIDRSSGGLERSDDVQVSNLSHLLQALDSQSASHDSKLVELSRVVSAGGYQVDPQVVSGKIIQEHMRTAA